jgi:hypothetical protein
MRDRGLPQSSRSLKLVGGSKYRSATTWLRYFPDWRPFMKRFLTILLGTGMVLGESWIATSVILHVDKGLSFLKESGSIMVRLIKRFD